MYTKANCFLFFLATALLTALLSQCARTSEYPAWTRQEDAIRQVGVFLEAYMNASDQRMPYHISELKTWAVSQKEFKDLGASEIWLFKDPDSGLSYDWIFAPAKCHQFQIYAPRTRGIVNQGSERAMRLVFKFEEGVHQAYLLSESEFESDLRH